MFSKYWYNFFGAAIHYGGMIGSCPFGWDWEENRVIAVKWREWLFQFIFLMVYAPYVSVLMTVKVIYYHAIEDYRSLALMYGLWNWAAMIFLVGLLQIIYGHDIQRCINEFFEYSETFEDAYITRKKKCEFKRKIWMLDIMMTAVGVIIGLEILATSTHHAFFPHDPAYPASLITKEDFTTSMFIALASFYFCGQCVVCTLIGLQVAAVTNFMFVVTLIILPEFRTGRKSRYITVAHLRTFQKLPLAYRTLQILFTMFMDIYGRLLIPLQTLCTNQILFCNFILLTRWEEIDVLHRIILIFWTMITMGGWTGILECSGTLFLVGARTLTSWKHWNWGTPWRNMYMKKFRRSSQPIRVHHGSCYTIRKSTVLEFCMGIVRDTFRIMLIDK
ncbi:unnamed protein product [Orchesella dallaii]|uniref:Odorant receptor n=1 Tax=Orchesella dallaii TaxID=48710 RepID=A0ABP1S7F1_9HEXA